MKIKGFFVLFICAFLVCCLGACSQRYAHVKKVRVNKNAPAKTVALKKQKNVPGLPQVMTPRITSPIGPVVSGPMAIETSGKAFATPSVQEVPPRPVQTITAADTIMHPPPLHTVKLTGGNFNEVFLTALIVGLISLLISFASAAVVIILLSSIYTGGHGLIVLQGFLAIYVILGAILFVPIVQLLKQLFQKLHKMEFTYAGTTYTLGDVKHMPKAVRLKRTWHNLVVSFLLLIPASLLFFLLPISVTFYAVFTWYFLKLLFILLFVHDK